MENLHDLQNHPISIFEWKYIMAILNIKTKVLLILCLYKVIKIRNNNNKRYNIGIIKYVNIGIIKDAAHARVRNIQLI